VTCKSLKLCTFEIRTHLGRHRRLGAVMTAGIVDLNFAYAAKEGSQKIADALLPAGMREFLEGESRSMAAARDACRFFAENGPSRGLNDETLLYQAAEVKLAATLPNPASV